VHKGRKEEKTWLRHVAGGVRDGVRDKVSLSRPAGPVGAQRGGNSPHHGRVREQLFCNWWK